MREIKTVGLDLAKNVFHLVGCDERGKQVKRKRLRRKQVLAYFAQLPPCLVGMEACAGAHYWGRQLEALGHRVRLIPPQYVKPFVQGNKNDYNDALAIAEAVVRPQMRFVAVKTPSQQDIQALHRLRQARIAERTALNNQIRGLLAEYGIVLPKGLATLRKRLPEILEDAENGLSDIIRPLLSRSYQQLRELDGHIEAYDTQLARHAREEEAIQRLQTIPGFGPVVASVFFSQVGNGSAFPNGRGVSAATGLVPAQNGTGGDTKLLGISKRGDRPLRALLVHGARSVARQAPGKEDDLSRWVVRLIDRRGFNKAVVALANKLARIGWAVLRHNTVYQPAWGRE